MFLDYEKLYNTYFMEIYSFVMTIVKSAHMAEEITQEVFFKALKTKRTYEGRSSEFTWLCAIAKNTAMDALKKSSRTQTLEEDVVSDDNMEKSLEDEEISLKIHQILHNMDEPYEERYWSIALPITTFCLLLPWMIFLCIRYCKAHPFVKTGILTMIIGAFSSVVNDITNGIVEGSIHIRMQDADFSRWDSLAVINGNIMLIVLMVSIGVGVLLIGIGAVLKKRKREDEKKLRSGLNIDRM